MTSSTSKIATTTVAAYGCRVASQTSPMASIPGIGPLLGALPLLGTLPFYDFVPMCLQKSGTNIVGVVQSGLPGVGALGGCVANASGIFRATLVPVT